jgi:hypothetical protein
MSDPRLNLAAVYHEQHDWLEKQLDELTLQSRYCLEQERRLREAVRREREDAVDVRVIQESADRELVARR